MEFLIIIVVLVAGIWIFIKTRPTKPILKKDLEQEGVITLAEAKKIYRQFLKDNSEEFYHKEQSKSEINEDIKIEVEDVTDMFEEEMDGYKEELEELKEEEEKDEDGIQVLEQKIKDTDASNTLLWLMNARRKIDTKTLGQLFDNNFD